jgi:type III secretion protein V
MKFLMPWLRRVDGQELAIVFILVATVTMMVLPVPTILIDVLIACNLGFAVLLLMIGVYRTNPVDFSALPAIIVISTVFRLALNITTTRMILAEGDAGEIVRTFGEFVIAGSIAVGLVVFVVISIVQFMVISKGAERVAEVAARFTLDALPGKQMSIEADIKSGEIDQAEARRRRRRLERESQLYGSMDGAMKFVKGDAIAGVLIVFINLIGGISIGTMSRGMAFGTAFQEYALLSVGDALISQIPALFISMTAAMMVTKVAGETDANLGRDMAAQVVSDPKALGTAAVVVLGMGFIPGFPTPVFLIVGLALAGAAFAGLRKAARVALEGQAADAAGADSAEATETGAAPEDSKKADKERGAGRVILHVGRGLHDALGGDTFIPELRKASQRLSDELGVFVPKASFVLDDAMADNALRLDIDGLPALKGDMPLDHVLLLDDADYLAMADLPAVRQSEAPGRDLIWVPDQHSGRLTDAGIAYRDLASAMIARVTDSLRHRITTFVGIQEVSGILSDADSGYGNLLKEVVRTSTLQRVADVFRRLLDEQVSVRNLRLVLEALAEWGEREQDPVLLTEYVRSHMKQQISHQHAGPDGVIPAFVFSRRAEATIREALRTTAAGTYLMLDELTSNHAIVEARKVAATRGANRRRPVIVTAIDVRRYVRAHLVRNGFDIPVLSYQDLSDDYMVQPIGYLELDGSDPQSAPDVDAMRRARPVAG